MIRKNVLHSGLLFLALLAISFAAARSQTQPADTKPASPAHVDATAKPDDTPTANPARPTVTNPATLPPAGYLQFEQGYLGSLTSPETRSQYGVNNAIKLAVHPRVMLFETGQGFARSTDYTSAPASTQPGQVQLGVQAIAFAPKTPDDPATRAPKKTPRPTIAVSYLHSIYTGNTTDIDYGSATNTFLLLLSGDVGGFHYDTNYIVNEQDGVETIILLKPVAGGGPVPVSHNVRRAQFAQTLSVNHSLFNPNFQLSVELYHFTQPLVFNDDNGNFAARANLVDILFAPSYQLRPNLVFDGGCSRGLTSTSTRWQSFAGFTYLLPHRLWPEHKP